jgi:hypothetical protein
MPKVKISEYSTVNTDNSDIEGINISEGCAPSGINNAIRELMVHLKEFQTGASGDAFTFAGGVLISGSLNTATGAMIMSGANVIAHAAGTVSAPSIYANGDTNTGIFFPAADTIAFAEGGVEAMRIDSSGNLGIGTTSPAHPFHVTKEIAGYQAYFNNDNGSAQGVKVRIKANDSGNFNMLELVSASSGSDVTAMVVRDDGNVGIGTSSPAGTLDVLTTAGEVIYASSNRSTDGQYISGLLQRAKNSSGSYLNYSAIYGLISSNTASSEQGALTFWTKPSSSSPTERMRIDSSGNVGIGTTGYGTYATTRKAISLGEGSTISAAATGGDPYITIASNAYFTTTPDWKYVVSDFASYYEQYNGTHVWTTAASGTAGNAITFTERARITSGGDLLVGRTVDSDNAGITLSGEGWCRFNRGGAVVMVVNRLTDDGTIISLRQASTEEGSISVSGNTVSYNAFCGSHWSQLQEGRGYNPDIPRGTVMSSIGEMSEWKSVTWTETIEHPAIPAVEAKEAVLDEEGNVVEPAVEAVEGKDAWTESTNKRDTYLGNLPVGATFEEDGFTKTVVDDGNERLPKVKISDVVGDKAVYGVFQTWDGAQDMLVSSLGAFVVRIAAGVTVQIGDLLESNGDGCAKVQDDDVIRSKTIGKVTSTVATATYADGSYTVPCVLYCG